ncbi:hypothetical protein JZ751_013192 [Albula glossodonta]|uniref:Uncharacterized protein n=1 Tax=Albula glossodonta TaxID=121402 RepID=A0A8T2NXG3_9TELE|nr:hypothetical protein JZ751_013192 [Albula glossodonta]
MAPPFYSPALTFTPSFICRASLHAQFLATNLARLMLRRLRNMSWEKDCSCVRARCVATFTSYSPASWAASPEPPY